MVFWAITGSISSQMFAPILEEAGVNNITSGELKPSLLNPSSITSKTVLKVDSRSFQTNTLMEAQEESPQIFQSLPSTRFHSRFSTAIRILCAQLTRLSGSCSASVAWCMETTNSVATLTKISEKLTTASS